MRNHAIVLIILVVGCGTHTDLGSNAATLKLAAPIDVTGTWSVIDTSHVLSCTYDLAATASGGMDEEELQWGDATIRLFAPPALPATQPHPARRVAQWFGAPIIRTGSTRTARLSVGRERPFTAEHQMTYRTSRGISSTATATVNCHAPS
jgi:hypothetical protein